MSMKALRRSPLPQLLYIPVQPAPLAACWVVSTERGGRSTLDYARRVLAPRSPRTALRASTPVGISSNSSDIDLDWSE